MYYSLLLFLNDGVNIVNAAWKTMHTHEAPPLFFLHFLCSTYLPISLIFFLCCNTVPHSSNQSHGTYLYWLVGPAYKVRLHFKAFWPTSNQGMQAEKAPSQMQMPRRWKISLAISCFADMYRCLFTFGTYLGLINLHSEPSKNFAM